MKHVTPYLIFDGNCREAMNFYKQCIGGELTTSTFGEGDPNARAEAKDQAGLDRLLAQIDEQLALSGLKRGPQAGH